jgi:hypothetical protein
MRTVSKRIYVSWCIFKSQVLVCRTELLLYACLPRGLSKVLPEWNLCHDANLGVLLVVYQQGVRQLARL